MFVLRCLHPSAAVSLIMVLGHVIHYRYAVLAGAFYGDLTGKRHPNKQS